MSFRSIIINPDSGPILLPSPYCRSPSFQVAAIPYQLGRSQLQQIGNFVHFSAPSPPISHSVLSWPPQTHYLSVVPNSLLPFPSHILSRGLEVDCFSYAPVYLPAFRHACHFPEPLLLMNWASIVTADVMVFWGTPLHLSRVYTAIRIMSAEFHREKLEVQRSTRTSQMENPCSGITTVCQTRSMTRCTLSAGDISVGWNTVIPYYHASETPHGMTLHSNVSSGSRSLRAKNCIACRIVDQCLVLAKQDESERWKFRSSYMHRVHLTPTRSIL